jgi:hypothetical protein
MSSPVSVSPILVVIGAAVLVACASNGKGGVPVGAGGQGGEGGSGGEAGAGSESPDAAGGMSGSGGVTSVGGASGGVGAEAGVPAVDAARDAPVAADAVATSDASGDVHVVLDDPSTWPGGAYGKDFIVACPDGASRTACCQHYCACMMKNCGTVSSVRLPKDCMAACVSPEAVQGWDLRCRVYNCFESLNPLAQKDRVAHCEHAGARGAGDTFAKCHVAGEPTER